MPTADDPGSAAPGLRERKKARTRQLISDTATALFLERGFDAVTVAEVARAAEVSEKTVFNYFPTKEALVLDREQAWAAAVVRALGRAEPGVAPGAAVAAAVVEELAALLGDGGSGSALPATATRGVVALIARTPTLRAAQADMAERVAGTATDALAARSGLPPDDPRVQIAAVAVVGLWRVQFRSLARHAAAGLTARRLRERVAADVRQAAALIDAGLATLDRPT